MKRAGDNMENNVNHPKHYNIPGRKECIEEMLDIFGIENVFFPFGTVFVALSFVTMFFVRHGDAKPEAKVGLEALDNDD